MAQWRDKKDRFSQYLSSRTSNTPRKSVNNQQSIYSMNSSAKSIQNYFTPKVQNQPMHEENSTTYKFKKLRKQKRFTQKECSICLDDIKNMCYLECNHSFCKQCLLGWLENSSKCPKCRKQSQYYQFENEDIKIQKKQFNNQQWQDSSFEEVDNQCYICMNAREGDILLICDGCEGYMCHVMCDPTLNGIEPSQQQQWYCYHCRY